MPPPRAPSSTGPVVCDYLVTSANVEDLAFVDRLLVEHPSWTVVIADARAQPGGGWNDVAPFAKLDMPSALYGVGSRPLDTPHALRRDEILQYCHGVVQHFVQRGRVRYFPTTTFDGKHLCSIVDSDDVWQVRVRRKVVRSTFGATSLAAWRSPFHVAAGTLVVPPKELPLIAPGHARYVVIGAGRSAMETVVWLLKQGISAEALHWVVPEDMWLLNSTSLAPEHWANTASKFWDLFARCSTVEDLELELEKAGLRCRVDTSRRPTAFHGIGVTQQELSLLRRVTPNVRRGRVREVQVDRLVLDEGLLPTGPGTLYVDCTAGDVVEGSQRRAEPVPIFEADRITLQLVREVADNGFPHSCFSAALIGHIECVRPDGGDAMKNALCSPMPPAATVVECLRNELVSMEAKVRMHPSVAPFLMVGRPGPLASLSPSDLLRLLQDRADAGAKARVMDNLKRLVGNGGAGGVDEVKLSRKTSDGSTRSDVSTNASSALSPLLSVCASAPFDFDELDRLEQVAQEPGGDSGGVPPAS